MSIGNQEFGIPRKYQYQIGVWYLCLKFLGIFLVFYRNLEYDLVKSWFRFVIFLKKASLASTHSQEPCEWFKHDLEVLCNYIGTLAKLEQIPTYSS